MIDRTQAEATAKRLTGYLKTIAERYPNVWQYVDQLRAAKGDELPDWPDWCFLPISGSLSIVTSGIPEQIWQSLPVEQRLEMSGSAQVLAALAAWRPTQGIYWFHPEVFRSVTETDLSGALPVELFLQLPEWCVYIPATAEVSAWNDVKWHGFFAHLEYDVNTGRRELRFLVDTTSQEGKPDFIPFILHIDEGTIEGALESFRQEVWRQKQLHYPDLSPDFYTGEMHAIAVRVQPLVALVLYLCSLNAEVSHARKPEQRPGRPRPTATKRGPRLFPPSAPSAWEVGFRIGAAIEQARRQSAGEETSTDDEVAPRRSPAPHIRRAHWHSFWTGPRSGERKVVVKWLPPIPVGVGEVIPTIRPVRG